jgi:uncharacterized lipoprotein YbaY
MRTFSFLEATLRSAPMLRDAIAMAVVVVLCGCAPRTSTPASPVAPIPATRQTTRSHRIQLHPRARDYLERIKIPPGADFHRATDRQPAGRHAAGGDRGNHAAGCRGPPYEFSLQYDPAKLRPNGHTD